MYVIVHLKNNIILVGGERMLINELRDEAVVKVATVRRPKFEAWPKQTEYPNVYTFAGHAGVEHLRTCLIDKNVSPKDYKIMVKMLIQVMMTHTMTAWETVPVAVYTRTPTHKPSETYVGQKLADISGEKMQLVRFVRAGDDMADGAYDFLSCFDTTGESLVEGHVDVKRNLETHIANVKGGHVEAHYVAEPMAVGRIKKTKGFDQMLAGATSAIESLKFKKKNGVDLSQVSLYFFHAAPEGLEKLSTEFPEVIIFIAGMGTGLDETCYIFGPYWGDAGQSSKNTLD